MAVKAGATIDLNALKVAGEPNKYITYIDNTGIRVHEARAENTNFIQINSTGMQVYKGGQTDAYKIAEFGSTTYIGKHNGSQSYMKLDASSFKMIDKEGGEYASIEDLRGTSGTANLTIAFIGNGEQKRFDLLPVATNDSYTVNVSDSSGGTVTKTTNSITFSTAPTEGSTITITYSSTDQSAKIYTFGFRNNSTNKGACSICVGVNGTASGNFSFVAGTGCMATGYASHAEGGYTIASGEYSHAEGYGVLMKSSGKASGKYSHVEGWGTTASGIASHAEGHQTIASGMISHAEGRNTTASGAYSHASGLCTSAIGTCQFVIGENNIPDTEADETTGRGHFAFIIGNGSDVQDIQSNALAVDWKGNIVAQGMAGQIIMFAGHADFESNVPNGWLVCDGRELSKDEYPELHAVIGTTYGGRVDADTTINYFNLPNFSGRMPIGVGYPAANNDGTSVNVDTDDDRVLGDRGGQGNVTLTVNQMPVHAHTYTYRDITTFKEDGDSTQHTSISGTTTGTTGNAGGGQAHNNMPPYFGIYFLINAGRPTR